MAEREDTPWDKTPLGKLKGLNYDSPRESQKGGQLATKPATKKPGSKRTNNQQPSQQQPSTKQQLQVAGNTQGTKQKLQQTPGGQSLKRKSPPSTQDTSIPAHKHRRIETPILPPAPTILLPLQKEGSGKATTSGHKTVKDRLGKVNPDLPPRPRGVKKNDNAPGFAEKKKGADAAGHLSKLSAIRQDGKSLKPRRNAPPSQGRHSGSGSEQSRDDDDDEEDDDDDMLAKRKRNEWKTHPHYVVEMDAIVLRARELQRIFMLIDMNKDSRFDLIKFLTKDLSAAEKNLLGPRIDTKFITNFNSWKSKSLVKCKEHVKQLADSVPVFKRAETAREVFPWLSDRWEEGAGDDGAAFGIGLEEFGTLFIWVGGYIDIGRSKPVAREWCRNIYVQVLGFLKLQYNYILQHDGNPPARYPYSDDKMTVLWGSMCKAGKWGDAPEVDDFALVPQKSKRKPRATKAADDFDLDEYLWTPPAPVQPKSSKVTSKPPASAPKNTSKPPASAPKVIPKPPASAPKVIPKPPASASKNMSKLSASASKGSSKLASNSRIAAASPDVDESATMRDFFPLDPALETMTMTEWPEPEPGLEERPEFEDQQEYEKQPEPGSETESESEPELEHEEQPELKPREQPEIEEQPEVEEQPERQQKLYSGQQREEESEEESEGESEEESEEESEGREESEKGGEYEDNHGEYAEDDWDGPLNYQPVREGEED